VVMPTCVSKVRLVVVHQLLEHAHVLQDVDGRCAHSITTVLVCKVSRHHVQAGRQSINTGAWDDAVLVSA